MNNERSDHAAQAVPTGPPPPVTFTRAGVLGGDPLYVRDGLGASDVWRCERCKALVLADDCYDHLAFHCQYGLERWPDPDSGNLVREDTEEDT